MAIQDEKSGAVPTSSGLNRYATGRTLLIAGVVLALVLVALFAPW